MRAGGQRPAPARRPGWPARRPARCPDRRCGRAPSASRSCGRPAAPGRPAAARVPRSSPAAWLAVRQPLAFQPGSHSVMPLSTYWLSRYSVTAHGRLSASSAWITAISSMRLLVVPSSPPNSSFSVAPDLQQHAPAAGAGIALAGAVGVDLDWIHECLLCHASVRGGCGWPAAPARWRCRLGRLPGRARSA